MLTYILCECVYFSVLLSMSSPCWRYSVVLSDSEIQKRCRYLVLMMCDVKRRRFMREFIGNVALDILRGEQIEYAKRRG